MASLVLSSAGTPTICVTVWAVLRLHFDDTGYVSWCENIFQDSDKGEMEI